MYSAMAIRFRRRSLSYWFKQTLVGSVVGCLRLPILNAGARIVRGEYISPVQFKTLPTYYSAASFLFPAYSLSVKRQRLSLDFPA